MYNCYNSAHKYLYDRYGGSKHLTTKISNQLKFKNKKQRKEILDNVTETDYYHIINADNVHKSKNEIDILILTLMGQYSYSIVVKKELYELLKHNKIIN